jgi:hypothetical protein
MSERSVRTCLDKLEQTREIAIKSTNRFSVITVCKYASYQLKEKPSDQQNANKRPTNDQQTTTTIEGKEGKEGKEESTDIVKNDVEKPITLHALCKNNFMSLYEEMVGSSYYWTPKDGANVNQIIKKIKTKMVENKIDTNDNKLVLNGFSIFIRAIQDKWMLDNFSIPNINSKFNDQYKQIKERGNPKEGKSITERAKDLFPE